MKINSKLVFFSFLAFSYCVQVYAEWDPPIVNDFPEINQNSNKPEAKADLITIGEKFFGAKFNEKDGAGRPGATGDSKPTHRSPVNNIGLTRIAGPDAMACSSCHNDPKTEGLAILLPTCSSAHILLILQR